MTHTPTAARPMLAADVARQPEAVEISRAKLPPIFYLATGVGLTTVGILVASVGILIELNR